MISRVQSVALYVSDQDRAKAFFIDKCGFEEVIDVPMSLDKRWLALRPPGAETQVILYTPEGQEDRIGSFGHVVFTADDVQATYEQMTERGVEFVKPPEFQPWGGTMAQFKDPDGNLYLLHD